ncbi:MAG: carboxypeptidase regulatory-like domain-containing protein [Acidobacteriota bacterium]
MSTGHGRPWLCRLSGLVLIAALLLWAGGLYGQERTARIYGKVTDATGGVVPGAQVVLTNTETGVRTTLLTSDTGMYNAPRVFTGPYQIEAEMTGFKKFVRAGLLLLPGDTLEINIPLQVGEVSDVITVQEQSPLVDTSTGVTKDSLELKLVENLPLGSRSSAQLLRIIPGAVKMYNGDYTIGGLDSGKMGWSMDGTNAQDNYDSRATHTPPPDSLREFTATNSYSAEYGNTGGAAVLMTTKSGTNRFHGSVYDYFRSENLNANSFQNNYYGRKKSESKYHQLGFTAGGPIFLPWLYDGRGTKASSSSTIRTSSSPTPLTTTARAD